MGETDMGRLAGKIALISGASRGQGAAEAKLFAAEGAAVVLTDVLDQEGEALATALRKEGANAVFRHLDVTSAQEWQGTIDYTGSLHGKLDILVNNAGIASVSDTVKQNMATAALGLLSGAPATESVGATRTMSDSQWRRTLSIHLDGTFYCTREALKIMEPKRSGKIINMASIAGTTGLLGSPDYSAAKAGIIGLTKAVAREVIGCGIYVNAIAPGFIDTPLLDVMDEPMKQMIALQTPIGRLGTPEEVAALALYLASDDSSYTVGQILSPNGGYDI
jgi:3-oxoacyl-[acyl-carrier protein] reductase